MLAVLTWSGHIEVWHLIVARARGSASSPPSTSRCASRCTCTWSTIAPTCRTRSRSTRSWSTRRASSARRSPALLLAVVSEAVCFALNALSFVAVIVAIAQHALAARAGRPAPSDGGFWSKLGRGRALRVRLRAGARDAAAGRRAVVDDQPVLVADADLREGHLRRRPADARLPAVGGGRRRAGVARSISRARHDPSAWGASSRWPASTAGLALAAFAYLRVLPARARC